MTAAARFYERLEPIAYDDIDGLLEDLATAIMAPLEVCEIARDTDTHVAWETLWNPATCPAELLDWLAVAAGVILPPSALTEAEKRARIAQSAGAYRGTEDAWRTEIQRSLTGSKTVRFFTFVGGDRWAVTIKTRTSETPDAAAVERTARAQKPVGLVLTFLTGDDPIWLEGGKTWAEIAPGVTWANATVADIEE